MRQRMVGRHQVELGLAPFEEAPFEAQGGRDLAPFEEQVHPSDYVHRHFLVGYFQTGGVHLIQPE